MLTDLVKLCGLCTLLGLATACGSAEVNRSKPAPSEGTGGSPAAPGAELDSGAGGGLVLHVDGSAGPTPTMSDAGSGVPNGNTCAAATAEVEPIPLDIALLVDTSYSMDFDLRWQYVKGGLLSFVSAPGQGSLGLALQFFPLRAQCDVDAYATPALPMSGVTDDLSSITDTLEARRMSGGTPIVQALQGVGQYAAKWAAGHTDHKTVIVIATDGVPDDTCAASSLNPPNDLPNAVKTAKALAGGTPPLPVFVIGVGEELDALNEIANAGGTGSAVLIRDGASAEEQLALALRDIRKQSLGCDYLVPKKSTGAIDYDTVNVDFTESGRTRAFYYATDAAGCALKPDAAWYYDDAKNPTKVILCPDTCTSVTAAPAARIDIAYGCKRREVR